MSRFCDRLIAQYLEWANYGKAYSEIADALKSCTTISADQLVGTANSKYREANSSWEKPSFAPPFEHFFVEYHCRPFPGWMNFDLGPERKRVSLPMPHSVGMYVSTLIPDDEPEQLAFLLDGVGRTPKSIYDATKWVLCCNVFTERSKGRGIASDMTYVVQIDKDGRRLGDDIPAVVADKGNYKGIGLDVFRDYPACFDGHNGAVFMCFDYLLEPILLALSLMNCKNVELVDNLPPPKLSAQHQKEHGEPLVVYKTIKVNPIRTVKHPTDLNAPPAPESKGNSNMPLSIWRGHFKDYRDGKGLFGKYREVYWWDQHVRGSIENGATIKDYDILAPSETK